MKKIIEDVRHYWQAYVCILVFITMLVAWLLALGYAIREYNDKTEQQEYKDSLVITNLKLDIELKKHHLHKKK